MMRNRQSLASRKHAGIAILATAFVAVGACAQNGETRPAMTASGERPTKLRSGPDIERFMKIRAPGSPTLAPDGTLYVTEWPDGINQLYKRPANTRPSYPMKKLTEFEDGLSGYALSPDGRNIVLSAAVGGSEQNDLFLMDAQTEEMETIYSDPDVVYSFLEWLPDSSGFLYRANDQDPRFFYIYRYDLGTGESEELLARNEPGYWFVADVTDDSTRILLAKYFSVADVTIYELETTGRDLRELPIGRGPTHSIPIGYLPGEREIALVSDVEDGFRKLYVLNLRNGQLREPRPDLATNECEGGYIDDERRFLALSFNVDGYAEPRLTSLPTFTDISLPDIEKGLIGSVEIEGDTMIWRLSNAQTPGVTYQWEIGDRSMDPEPLTRAETQGINLNRFPLPELIRYESFDGLEIPAFLYLPPNYDKERDGPIPFIAWYHGGPEGQTRPRFNASLQYFLSRGFGVIQPNVRGSTGYGREYHQMDNYKGRWDSVKDGVEAVKWLVREGYARRGKVAAYGGSYGGFMSVATVIEGGSLYGASVNIVGLVNFQTFLEQTKSYRRALRKTEYGPLSDPEFLASVSPVNRIDEINVPMFIAHGLNDPRVPVGEAMQIAVGLQKRGYDPELLFFPDEGHGFRKLENRLLYQKRAARFLEKHIGF